jgi:hypothetical protein
MDKGTAKNRWSWLPAMMPGVQRLLADKKGRDGAAHVAECWKRGVIQREPGWFYAREGAIAVGTPWGLLIAEAEGLQGSQALLVLRDAPEKEGAPHAAT